jgi:hypothetical protein
MKPRPAPTLAEHPAAGKPRIVRAAILFDELSSGTRAKELLESLLAGFKEEVRCELEIWNVRVLQIEWARRLITEAIPPIEILIVAQRGDSALAPEFAQWIEALPPAHSTESPTLIAVLNPLAEDGSEVPKIRDFLRAAAARQGRAFFTLTIYPDHPDDAAERVPVEEWLASHAAS